MITADTSCRILEVDPLFTCTDLPQAVVIRRLKALHFPDAKYWLDPTFGGGGFYPNEADLPTVGGDYLHERTLDVVLNYHHLPFGDAVFDLTVFDPPFQPQTVPGKIGVRFTKVDGGMFVLKQSVIAGLLECRRVSRIGVIVKVQDYIHSHRPVWMSAWVHEALGEPYDFCMVRQKSKMRAENWTTQRSVWRNHSTFWVYRWKSIR